MILVYTSSGRPCNLGDLVPFERELATLVDIDLPTNPRSNGWVVVKHTPTGEHRLYPSEIGAEWFDRQDQDPGDYGLVPVRCPECRRKGFLRVHAASYAAWAQGTLLVQAAFPELSPDEREALITGICSECWTRIFSSSLNEGEAE